MKQLNLIAVTIIFLIFINACSVPDNYETNQSENNSEIIICEFPIITDEKSNEDNTADELIKEKQEDSNDDGKPLIVFHPSDYDLDLPW